MTSDQALYQGEYKEGERHGKGKLSLLNGNVVEGDFSGDKPNGHCVYTWANGNRYEGQMVDGDIEGRGRLDFQAGGYYEGEWHKDKKHGHGFNI
mmetsp:Transcript_26936/g.36010  ORF Transcript_26936/g.36010 Transcript_26936/m.36010 type:complete len:94 (+) Transcript_26936:637-918(+)